VYCTLQTVVLSGGDFFTDELTTDLECCPCVLVSLCDLTNLLSLYFGYAIQIGKPHSLFACVCVYIYIKVWEKISGYLDDYINAWGNFISVYIDVTTLKVNILNNMLFSSNYLPAFFSEGNKVHLYHCAVCVYPFRSWTVCCHGILYELIVLSYSY